MQYTANKPISQRAVRIYPIRRQLWKTSGFRSIHSFSCLYKVCNHNTLSCPAWLNAQEISFLKSCTHKTALHLHFAIWEATRKFRLLSSHRARSMLLPNGSPCRCHTSLGSGKHGLGFAQRGREALCNHKVSSKTGNLGDAWHMFVAAFACI